MASSRTASSLSERKRTRADKWVWLSRRASRFSSLTESCLSRLTIDEAISVLKGEAKKGKGMWRREGRRREVVGWVCSNEREWI